MQKNKLKPQNDWIKEKDKDNLGHKLGLNLKVLERPKITQCEKVG